MALSSASWSALFHGRRLAYTVLLTLSAGIHAVGLHMLGTVLPSIVAAAQSGNLSVGGIVTQVIAGGAGGAILTAIIGAIKNRATA